MILDVVSIIVNTGEGGKGASSEERGRVRGIREKDGQGRARGRAAGGGECMCRMLNMSFGSGGARQRRQ